MLKVLVVDDEYLVRLGIKETIDWEKYGFEICAEGKNGNEGYDKYLEFLPDIIITDIRMKKATGLELLQKLKSTKGFNSEVIILTAFDEFGYVKTALDNGASAYILKPIKESELISVMLELKEKIIKKREEAHIIENLTPHIPYLKNSFLNDILLGNITNEEDIKNKCEFYGIQLPENEYTVANIKVDNLGLIVGEHSVLHENLLETLMFCSEIPDALKYIYCEQGECSISLIIFYHDDNYKLLKSSFSAINNFLTGIKDQFQVSTGTTVSIGHSSGYFGVENLKKAYKESCKAIAYKSFVGSNSIIDFTSVPKEMSGALVIPNSEVEAILDAIRNDEKEKAYKILNSFYLKVKNTPSIDIESLKDVVLEMIIILLRYKFQNNDIIDTIYNRNLVPSNELKRLETVDDIIKWINDIVDKMFYPVPNEIDVQSQKIIDVIKRDYAKAITVQQVADELYISTYYLMHLFKEQTGKTFNQFVTEYRVERAKELIKKSEYKVYEIGSMVGYNDPTYFSYIFKKVTGETPKKYYENHIGLSF